MERYEKPILNAKAYAHFENVFTACTKGNEKSGCTQCWPDDNPGVDVHGNCVICGKIQSSHAAMNGQFGS